MVSKDAFRIGRAGISILSLHNRWVQASCSAVGGIATAIATAPAGQAVAVSASLGVGGTVLAVLGNLFSSHIQKDQDICDAQARALENEDLARAAAEA